jgi:hypothetical protein
MLCCSHRRNVLVKLLLCPVDGSAAQRGLPGLQTLCARAAHLRCSWMEPLSPLVASRKAAG